MFERNRTDVAEARVETSPVVEALNVIEQGGTGGGPGRVAMAVHGLVFQAAPEGLYVGVVIAVAFPAHRGAQAVARQHAAERGTGKLRAAVRVYDQPRGRPALRDGHLQGPHCDPRVQVPVHRLTHDSPGVEVEQRHQVKPAFAGEDRRGIDRSEGVRTQPATFPAAGWFETRF